MARKTLVGLILLLVSSVGYGSSLDDKTYRAKNGVGLGLAPGIYSDFDGGEEGFEATLFLGPVGFVGGWELVPRTEENDSVFDLRYAELELLVPMPVGQLCAPWRCYWPSIGFATIGGGPRFDSENKINGMQATGSFSVLPIPVFPYVRHVWEEDNKGFQYGLMFKFPIWL